MELFTVLFSLNYIIKKQHCHLYLGFYFLYAQILPLNRFLLLKFQSYQQRILKRYSITSHIIVLSYKYGEITSSTQITKQNHRISRSKSYRGNNSLILILKSAQYSHIFCIDPVNLICQNQYAQNRVLPQRLNLSRVVPDFSGAALFVCAKF